MVLEASFSAQNESIEYEAKTQIRYNDEDWGLCGFVSWRVKSNHVSWLYLINADPVVCEVVWWQRYWFEQGMNYLELVSCGIQFLNLFPICWLWDNADWCILLDCSICHPELLMILFVWRRWSDIIYRGKSSFREPSRNDYSSSLPWGKFSFIISLFSWLISYYESVFPWSFL